MKTVFYTLAIITLLSTVTSCTADEMEPAKKTNTTSSTAKDEDIVPPPPVVPK